mmetsp:Transcript_9035/g.27160  ORF Transcript_9035/g.27160 Transcript_9035/m.27160 type:complete len:344 (+) Transcript_9035:45-1076(+)
MREAGEYVLTRKTVSHHNDERSAWVVVDGVVYDVTLFLESHPGGAEVLKEHLGKDVTRLMNGEDPAGRHTHSVFAYKMLSKYKVGKLFGEGDRDELVLDGNIDPATGKELVDWSKPILPQVGALGDRYFTWIHSFPTADHTVKMFPSDFVESLTKCPWYVPLVFWIPIIIACLAHYTRYASVDVVTFASYTMAGYVFWLFFEYTLHRFVFHLKTKGYVSNIFHFLLHGHHHITPMDYDRLVFPPVPACIVGGPLALVTRKALGFQAGYPVLLGFAVGYLMYDMTHFFIHFAVPKTEFFKNQKGRHVHHHYLQPDVNFGISNPLFDYVFGTSYEVDNSTEKKEN